MLETRYKVVVSGALTGEFDAATTRDNLAKLFRLDQKRAHALLSGKEHVVKNDVSEDVAMNYLIRIAEAGCECYLQEIPDETIPDFEEQRFNAERRQRFRRGPRPGAIVPDRRLMIRRAIDSRQYRQIIKENREIPLPFQSYPSSAAEE